jgi:hypothetical protein
MWLGVLPIIALASSPTARTSDVRLFTATTLGSLRMIPSSEQTKVLAVPRSIPIFFENLLNKPIYLILIDTLRKRGKKLVIRGH